MNFIGPNDGEGFRVFYDGAEVPSDTTKYSRSSSHGDGRIVVGRRGTHRDRDYSSAMVDELIFFNQTLTEAEILAIVASA